jgi:hypothetical protein
MKIKTSHLNYKIELSTAAQPIFEKHFNSLKDKMPEREAFLLAVRSVLGK